MDHRPSQHRQPACMAGAAYTIALPMAHLVLLAKQDTDTEYTLNI
jgi:hypothetical protein